MSAKQRMAALGPNSTSRTSRSTAIYAKLARQKASKKQLDRNGYPRPSCTDGLATFRNGNSFNISECKICLRCDANFILLGSEIPQGGPCIYHYGKCYDNTWTCCEQSKGSRGCKEERTHVHQDNLKDPKGFVKTRPFQERKNQKGVFAIDCEMSYTVLGLELTRVTIVDHNCRPIYDDYVKPYGRILSYNTEYSGITADHLKGVTTTLADVQKYILNTFSSDTIFIGHSLQSDFIALRLIHENVVDTSLVFNHPKGLRYKFALRTLAKKKLGIIIQSGTHDSIEDASTCMKIILQRIGM